VRLIPVARFMFLVANTSGGAILDGVSVIESEGAIPGGGISSSCDEPIPCMRAGDFFCSELAPGVTLRLLKESSIEDIRVDATALRRPDGFAGYSGGLAPAVTGFLNCVKADDPNFMIVFLYRLDFFQIYFFRDILS